MKKSTRKRLKYPRKYKPRYETVKQLYAPVITVNENFCNVYDYYLRQGIIDHFKGDKLNILFFEDKTGIPILNNTFEHRVSLSITYQMICFNFLSGVHLNPFIRDKITLHSLVDKVGIQRDAHEKLLMEISIDRGTAFKVEDDMRYFPDW